VDQDNIGQLSRLVTHSEIYIQTQHEQLPKTHLCLCYNILPASVAAQGKLDEVCVCLCLCVWISRAVKEKLAQCLSDCLCIY